MTWFYEDKPIEKIEDIPVEKAIGFIYIITQLSTGKRYLGKKLLTKSSRKTINGKTKKIRTESDWKTYWSSSPELKQLVREIGTQDFKREIIAFVFSKSELMYAEEFALYYTNALLDEAYFNGNIRSRIQRKWFEKNSHIVKENIQKIREKLK